MDNSLTGPSDSAEGGDVSPSDVLDHTRQAVIVFEGPKDLTALAAAINHEHEEAMASLCKGAAAALRAGELLLAAKAQVGHGKWLAWRKQHCRVAETTAQGYMRLARYCRAHPEKAAVLVSGSFTRALRSLPVPKSATDADLAEDDDAAVGGGNRQHPTPSLTARIASDKEKVGTACNYVWHLGMALQRAPPSNWGEHLEPLDREHLQRFAADIVARLTALAQELAPNNGRGD